MTSQGHVTTASLKQANKEYPTGQKFSLELMFAKFATAKIAKDLNPLKITFIRLYMPENNTRVLKHDVK